jgi:hypothetical protein
MRRETYVTLSFDMRNLSGSLATCDGLKTPSTPSVRNHDKDVAKRLLHLQIRVLGATTKAPYDMTCHDCKARVGNRHDGLPSLDFQAKSNMLVRWNIDLTIADINGLTARYCAYWVGGIA